MRQRKRIGLDEKVPVRITERQRDLILEHTFIGDELIRPLRLAEVKGKYIEVWLSLSDIDELQGWIAAHANHTGDRRLQRDLDRTYARIRKVEDSYMDPLSPGYDDPDTT